MGTECVRWVPGGNVWMEKQSLGRGAAESLWPLGVYWATLAPETSLLSLPDLACGFRLPQARRTYRAVTPKLPPRPRRRQRTRSLHARSHAACPAPAHPGGGACGLGSAPERPAPPPGPASSSSGTARSRELAAEPG